MLFGPQALIIRRCATLPPPHEICFTSTVLMPPARSSTDGMVSAWLEPDMLKATVYIFLDFTPLLSDRNWEPFILPH